MVLPSSLRMQRGAVVLAFPQIHRVAVTTPVRFLTQTSRVVVQCQPWFYLRLAAYSFFWLSEGAYG